MTVSWMTVALHVTGEEDQMHIDQPDRRRRIASSSRGSSRKTASPLAQDAERRGGDRRHQERLRELCDEVLASYRAAVGYEPLAAGERAEAERLLARFAPPLRS